MLCLLRSHGNAAFLGRVNANGLLHELPVSERSQHSLFGTIALVVAYLIINEAGILGSSSAIGKVSLATAANLSRVFVHQIEKISRELGTPSAFAFHQEGVVGA